MTMPKFANPRPAASEVELRTRPVAASRISSVPVAEESSATASESPCGSKAMPVGGSGRLMIADYLVGLGVEQGHGTVCVADREGFPVGAQCEREERLLAVGAEDADRRGAAKQRR